MNIECLIHSFNYTFHSINLTLEISFRLSKYRVNIKKAILIIWPSETQKMGTAIIKFTALL